MSSVLQPFRNVATSRKYSGCVVAALAVLSSTASTSFALLESKASPSKYRVHSAYYSQTQASSFASMKSECSALLVAQFPCLSDNYGYLVHDSVSGSTAAIDTPCAEAYKNELDRRGWKLTHIFNTHHHHDHTGGNLALKKIGDVAIIGPKDEQRKIPGIDKAVGEGDILDFAGSPVVVMDAGGHTKGHVSYYFPNQSKIFVGDCIFSLGCGRMFEGTPEQFWGSLEKHRALPDETLMYW